MKEVVFIIGATVVVVGVCMLVLGLYLKLVDGPRARRYHQMEHERLASDGILIEGVRYYACPFPNREESSKVPPFLVQELSMKDDALAIQYYYMGEKLHGIPNAVAESLIKDLGMDYVSLSAPEDNVREMGCGDVLVPVEWAMWGGHLLPTKSRRVRRGMGS